MHPSDDDLKQMFVYNELMECRRAVLIYPHVDGAVVRGGGSRVSEVRQAKLG